MFGVIFLCWVGSKQPLYRHLSPSSSHQETTQEGYLFSTPYLVSGLTFAGIPEYLPCVKSTNFTWDDATFTWDDSTNFLADDDCLACVESSTNFTWGDDTTTNFTILDDDCLPCVTSTNFTVDDHCRRVNVSSFGIDLNSRETKWSVTVNMVRSRCVSSPPCRYAS